MLVDFNNSSLLVIDVQEKLFGKIAGWQSIKSYIQKSIQVFSTFELPIIYTEQYPKGLGPTEKDIKNVLDSSSAISFEKTTFSCFPQNKSKDSINEYISSKQVIISGIETHICVLQTALDLKEHGFDVFILEESVGSRNENDKISALNRASLNGVTKINFEMLVFELLRDSKNKHFKELSRLIK